MPEPSTALLWGLGLGACPPRILCSALHLTSSWSMLFSMITTVTTKNMISIPASVGRRLGIKPGYRLDWQIPSESADTLSVRVSPDRATLSARLLGSGRRAAAKRKLVDELVREREEERA